MTSSDRDDGLARFEDELRAWGARPPRTPAAVARQRVSAQLPLARAPIGWLRLCAGAALVIVLVVATWMAAPRANREGGVQARGAFPPPLDPNVVVWVMDARTTVYFVLSPDGSAPGGAS
jgi:hypothetical protein